MVPFEDTTASIDEPKSARLEARTQPSVKEIINRAAALTGVDASSFIINAAYSAARSAIEAHKLTAIESEADRETFFGALETPSNPTVRLQEAFAQRKKLIANAD